LPLIASTFSQQKTARSIEATSGAKMHNINSKEKN